MPHTLDQKILQSVLTLGGDPEQIRSRQLPQYADADTLVVADVSQSGIKHRLEPVAAAAWTLMKAEASEEGVSLILLSGFRSFDRQFDILNRRVLGGESIDDLFRVLAPPGCSQHHTGKAADIGTMGCEPASTQFAETDAFQWLQRNAFRFGFSLSYPADNPYGYLYEPWHWFLDEACPE
ncbi:MAG: D-alanyl-D-alanine carboxypeptidase family protein [Gammaproteobacteria bacterium]